MAGQSYGFVGSQQSYVVPAGVTLLIAECWGAASAGGGYGTGGGYGGYIKATIPVTPGETLYVDCGGRNGWNGGGISPNPAYNGGGMSDVRRGGTGTGNIVVVAGGGGGMSQYSNPGNGGYPAGGDASRVAGTPPLTEGGHGGTATSGGAGGTGGGLGGAAFQGGAGIAVGSDATGGGGGGYYGGGGGGATGAYYMGAGGGGSSWAEPTAFNVFADSTILNPTDGMVVLTVPAPAAPILRTPAMGANLDGTTSFSLAWTYQQSGAGTTQTGWQARRDTLIGGVRSGTYYYYSVAAGSWSSSTPVNNTGSVQSFVTSGWTNGNSYAWSIATTDSNGLGAFATDSFFTAAAAPTVSVTAPTGTATTDPVAHFAWTPTTPGGPQTTYRAIVYTAAQYGAGGFTPGVGPSAWDSGVVGGNAVAATSTPLVNAVYRAYVQITQTGGQVSVWAYHAFTINCTPPATPTLTATLDSPNAQTVLVVTAAVTALTASIQYSDDGGTTWLPLRYGANLAMPGGGGKVATDYDLEAIQGGTRQYRAQVVTALGVPSAWSTVQSVTNTTDGFWLKSPLQNIPLVKLSVVPGSLTTAIPEPMTEHHAPGRPDAIIISDVLGLESGSITVFTMSATDDAALMALLLSQRTLLLQSPDHRQWYCRMVSPHPTDVPYVIFPGSYRTHAVSWTGQPRPA